jgi:ATP-binding cassette subfamily C protein
MISRRKVTTLALLMFASALTEGLGLVLLVPLLSALGSHGTGRLDRWLSLLGIPVTLDALLALFVVLVAVRAGVNLTRLMQAERFQLGLVDALRRRAWHALLHCDWRVLQGLSRADSASLLLGEVERVGYGVQQAVTAIGILVTLGAILLAALAISPLVTLGAGLGGIAVLGAYAGLRRRANLLGERLGRAFSDSYAAFADGLAALRVIKSLAGEARAEAEIARAVTDMRQAQLGHVRDRGIGQAALQLGGALTLATLVWLAAHSWGLGADTILPMVALFARALPLLGALQESWLQWRHARPALEATLALIATAEAAREPDTDGCKAPHLNRELRLEAVTVWFADTPGPTLAAIDLVLPARTVIAISGASGAGKSTLADLLAGLISPDAGTLSVDGIAIGPDARRAWRHQVGYVQQDPVLLSGSLRENLTWGRSYPDSAIESALSAASAQFALALPQGLDTVLGDGGRVLSGGERQRLMLARALLREPALLILDEATSALDAESEAAIVAALKGLKGRITMVIAAHRGALGNLADRTYRIEGGYLVS